jgi:hypothetical protein
MTAWIPFAAPGFGAPLLAPLLDPPLVVPLDEPPLVDPPTGWVPLVDPLLVDPPLPDPLLLDPPLLDAPPVDPPLVVPLVASPLLDPLPVHPLLVVPLLDPLLVVPLVDVLPVPLEDSPVPLSARDHTPELELEPAQAASSRVGERRAPKTAAERDMIAASHRRRGHFLVERTSFSVGS